MDKEKVSEVLFREHDLIVSAVDAAKNAGVLAGKDDNGFEAIIRELLDFFRNYADRYHHYKEELVLFPEMAKQNELLAEGVLKEMLENHEDFRSMLKSVEDFLDKKDYLRAKQQLDIYCEALLDHIAVENEEVFQMLETLFNDSELEKIFYRFEDSDREAGLEEKQRYEEKLQAIQKQQV